MSKAAGTGASGFLVDNAGVTDLLRVTNELH